MATRRTTHKVNPVEQAKPATPTGRKQPIRKGSSRRHGVPGTITGPTATLASTPIPSVSAHALVRDLPQLDSGSGMRVVDKPWGHELIWADTERYAGKILVIGSASALRGMKRTSTYSAARGAQLAYVQALGVELAAHGVQVNAIAQNFVDNPTYFPPEVQANPRFRERLAREVPLGRLVGAREDALFAAYLCSAAADCFVGQVFPVCGGWVTR